MKQLRCLHEGDGFDGFDLVLPEVEPLESGEVDVDHCGDQALGLVGCCFSTHVLMVILEALHPLIQSKN